MLQGFSGHLISEAFLEELVAKNDLQQAEPAHRELTAWRKRTWDLGPASSIRSMLTAGAEPLVAALGFDAVADVVVTERLGAATLRDGSRPATLLVAGWGHPLDPLWREAVTQAIHRASPVCYVFNGSDLRVVDAGRSFSRRYVQFDIDQTLDDPVTFAAFWKVLRVSALRDLVSASDRHAGVVCRALQAGVLSASADVLAALIGRRSRSDKPVNDAFDQALTIVYRMVFLLFAEARALVPMWHPIYRDSYSLDALRDAVEKPHGSIGLWDALRAIGRLAHSGCRAGDLRVTPFNGRLFAPARTPLAERRNLDNEAARRAVMALSTRPAADGAGRERIAYRDLGVEQLGAVYETLLDYRPAIDPPRERRGLPRVELQKGSGLRKSTGTFYTPRSIAEYIVRRTLGPLVRNATPDRILSLRIVDPAMGSGAFLVAACRYLAAAYEAALIERGDCQPGDISDAERAVFRRIAAERCLYGVDLNPMAVQLSRLSLWLATLAADRPLSFLDHRLQVGNSLLGAWLKLLRRSPAGHRLRRRAAHDAGATLFDQLDARETIRDLLPVRFSFETAPSDTIEDVRRKERALAEMNARGSALRKWRRVADVWCASCLAGDRVPAEAFGDLSDLILTNAGALPAGAAAEYLRAAGGASDAHRFFHWELEFPEVFFAADGTRLLDGGFDAVIGNPPWDMVRADDGGPVAGDRTSVLHFARRAGVYRAQSSGHVNCYQLFVERAIDLMRPGGRLGLVLPAGLAMDEGSSALRRLLLSKCDVDALVGVDNQRDIFPIHRSIRFVLLTAAGGSSTRSIACRFGVDDPAELESVGEEPAARMPWFHVHVQPSLLDRLSGPGLSIPWMRRPLDLAIADRAAALFPPLASQSGWSARFGRELNATDDRDVFRAGADGLPIVEGKQLAPFAVDVAASRWSIAPADALARLRDGRYKRRRLAYRDVASATNQLTLIAAILPADSVSTHTLFCLRPPLPLADQFLLCGLFNSFVVNFLVRLRVSTHVTTTIVERLPVPVRGHAPAAARDIAALARLLTRRPDPIAHARLQARVAALYELSVDEFDYVLSTFPLVPEDARRAALETFVKEAQQ